VLGSILVLDLLHAEAEDQIEKMIQCRGLHYIGWNLEDVALENAGALWIRRHHGAPNLENDERKILIHQNTLTVFCDGFGIVAASYSIPLGSGLEDKQRSLGLGKHFANGWEGIESGPD
jgi:hypothetical protein